MGAWEWGEMIVREVQRSMVSRQFSIHGSPDCHGPPCKPGTLSRKQRRWTRLVRGDMLWGVHNFDSPDRSSSLHSFSRRHTAFNDRLDCRASFVDKRPGETSLWLE